MEEHLKGMVVQGTRDEDVRIYNFRAPAPYITGDDFDSITGVETACRDGKYRIFVTKGVAFEWDEIHPQVVECIRKAPFKAPEW